METWEERRVVLPRGACVQPEPRIVRQGDCGACALGGILGMEPADLYARFGKWDLPIATLNNATMQMAIRGAKRDCLVDEHVLEMPYWTVRHPDMQAWGAAAWMSSLAWWNYLAMAVEAGFYAATVVDLNQGGPGSAVNHWVVLAGVRKFWTGAADTSTGQYEVLVSSPARPEPVEEWVEVSTFLRRRGGYYLNLARPVRE